jgi:hypothetical protein
MSHNKASCTEQLLVRRMPALRDPIEAAAAEEGRGLSSTARRILERWAAERQALQLPGTDLAPPMTPVDAWAELARLIADPECKAAFEKGDEMRAALVSIAVLYGVILFSLAASTQQSLSAQYPKFTGTGRRPFRRSAIRRGSLRPTRGVTHLPAESAAPLSCPRIGEPAETV